MPSKEVMNKVVGEVKKIEQKLHYKGQRYVGTGEPTQVITGDSDSWNMIMIKEVDTEQHQ